MVVRSRDANSPTSPTLLSGESEPCSQVHSPARDPCHPEAEDFQPSHPHTASVAEHRYSPPFPPWSSAGHLVGRSKPLACAAAHLSNRQGSLGPHQVRNCTHSVGFLILRLGCGPLPFSCGPHTSCLPSAKPCSPISDKYFPGLVPMNGPVWRFLCFLSMRWWKRR